MLLLSSSETGTRLRNVNYEWSSRRFVVSFNRKLKHALKLAVLNYKDKNNCNLNFLLLSCSRLSKIVCILVPSLVVVEQIFWWQHFIIRFINSMNFNAFWIHFFFTAMHLQRPQVLQHQINAAALAQASALAAASAAAISASSNVNTAVTSAAGTASLLNNNTSIQLSRQQEVRLQQLQLERERLKLRQQEIMQQVRSPSSSSNFNEVCSYIIFDETCDFVNVCRWRRNRLVYVSKIDFRWLIICCLNQIHTCTCEFCIDCCLVFFLHSKWRMVK